MAVKKKDYDELKKNLEVETAKKFPLPITIQAGSPSQRHPQILENLKRAVDGYWRNAQFKDAEEYAQVRVNDNINQDDEFRSFMNYLSTPPTGDESVLSADSLGSWTLETKEITGTLESAPSSIESPTTQPPSNPNVSKPRGGGLFDSIRNRPKKDIPKPPVESTSPPSTTTIVDKPIPDLSYFTTSDTNPQAPIDTINFPPITTPLFNSSGDGYGNKIICNELYRQGFLSEELWDADERYGELMFESDPKLVIGYQMWARKVVKFMRKNPKHTKLAYWLFKPWTEYMGYKMGVVKTPTTKGRFTNWIGTYFSYLVFDLYNGKRLLDKYNKVKIGIGYEG